MTPFTRVDLDQQAATVHLVIGEVEQVECLADAPILRQRPRQAGVAAVALEGLHELVSAHHAKLERAGRSQQVVPIPSNEVAIDAVASNAIQGPVMSGWINAVKAGVAKIYQAWAEAIAEQHEQAKDNVRIRCRVGDQRGRLQ